MDEIEQPNQQDIDFDVDPWEAALDAAEYEEDDEEDE